MIGDATDAEDIGVRLAEKLLESGAGEILSKMRQENRCDG